MNDAVFVSDMDRSRQRFDQLGRGTQRLRRALKVLSQAAAGDEFEDQVRPAVDLAGVVDLDDVRMPQASDGRSLGPESGQVVRRRLGLGPDHLERHDATEPDLPGLVDDAHPAASHFLQDFIAGHGRRVEGWADGRRPLLDAT